MQNKIYLSELKALKELLFEGKEIFYNERQEMQFQKTNLTIQLKNEGEVLHLKEGEILKKELILDQNDFELVLNVEQLKHLRWEGQFSKQNLKIGKWTPSWNDKILEAGGNYNELGQKDGIWVDIHENYWEGQQITYKGEYKSGNKIGKWEIEIQSMMSDPKIIGGGQYLQNTGEKTGIWIELHENFDQCSKIVLNGEYKNQRKVGKWAIINLDNDQIIGGGNYDENGLKNGDWVEPHSKFSEYCEVKFVGLYINGKKSGKWMIQLGSTLKNNIKIIGENVYDQENGLEIGKQTDLFENFSKSCQIVHNGECKNGKKIGYWQTLQLDFNQKIGGGKYDEDTGLKIGQWEEIHENFDKNLPVGYSGQYKNGKKIGKWEIKYLESEQSIGGGNYDQNGNKTGNWQELYSYFWRGCQVKFAGQYKNGKKYGQWDTLYQGFNGLNKIGGGNYDDVTGLKTGKWVELFEHFYRNIPIIYVGNYKNGVKESPFQQEELQNI